MHLTCWHRWCVCAQHRDKKKGRSVRACVWVRAAKAALFLLGMKEMEARRRRGTCKDSFETKAASPVKAKTGEGGIVCMKTSGEEARERRGEQKEIRKCERGKGEEEPPGSNIPVILSI